MKPYETVDANGVKTIHTACGSFTEAKPEIGVGDKYHYCYHTVDMDTGKVYTGRRSTRNKDDTYQGSGARLKGDK
jgi:transposase